MATEKKQRQRNMNSDINNEIKYLASLGLGGAAIKRRIEKDDRFLGYEKLPCVRTFQRDVDKMQADIGEKWSLADSDKVEDISLILEILGRVIFESKGSKCYLGKEEVKWIMKVYKAVPENTKPLMVWQLARLYMSFQKDKVETENLDHFIAFRPWRSKEDMQRYLKAIGWIYELVLDEDGREKLLRAKNGKGWISPALLWSRFLDPVEMFNVGFQVSHIAELYGMSNNNMSELINYGLLRKGVEERLESSKADPKNKGKSKDKGKLPDLPKKIDVTYLQKQGGKQDER